LVSQKFARAARTNSFATRHRDDLREVEIEGQHRATLCNGLREDVAIWKPMEPLVTEMGYGP
jgi:hypothetical protein